MQRYFFEFRLGKERSADHEGEEFASTAEALKYARLVACELMQGRCSSSILKAFVVVMDESGKELGRIFLADVHDANVSQEGRRILH